MTLPVACTWVELAFLAAGYVLAGALVGVRAYRRGYRAGRAAMRRRLAAAPVDFDAARERLRGGR